MNKIIDEKRINDVLKRSKNPPDAEIERILSKGAEKHGLTMEEVAVLLNANGPEHRQKIFDLASRIKRDIYGERLVLFAPLYISDYCVNDCAYCPFHMTNEAHARKKLTQDEIASETKCLIDMGHKRVLVEFGEDPDLNTIDYVCGSIRTIYSVKSGGGNIRRVNVNIAATTVENYRKLKAADIGTYQLFQETYHRETYEKLHRGPKADYMRQLTAHDRAREAGMDDMGLGVLFGLYDWRFEVLALIQHAEHMEKVLGVGPHTLSVPRFRPAEGLGFDPKYTVSDDDFLRLIAILRIAVPYTGMIISTRESPAIRSRAFTLGISQASAASITEIGGYTKAREGLGVEHGTGNEKHSSGQFISADDRPVDEVINSILDEGLIPSFCTACYRIGRTGTAFMELAKPGEIHNFCRPNAILTFAEYLNDYGDTGAKEKGGALIDKYLAKIDDRKLKEETIKRLARIRLGEHDLYF